MIDILSSLQQWLQPEGAAGPRYGGLPPWFNDPSRQGTLAGLPQSIRPTGQEDALAAFKAQLMGGPQPEIPPELLTQMMARLNKQPLPDTPLNSLMSGRPPLNSLMWERP